MVCLQQQMNNYVYSCVAGGNNDVIRNQITWI